MEFTKREGDIVSSMNILQHTFHWSYGELVYSVSCSFGYQKGSEINIRKDDIWCVGTDTLYLQFNFCLTKNIFNRNFSSRPVFGHIHEICMEGGAKEFAPVSLSCDQCNGPIDSGITLCPLSFPGW